MSCVAVAARPSLCSGAPLPPVMCTCIASLLAHSPTAPQVISFVHGKPINTDVWLWSVSVMSSNRFKWNKSVTASFWLIHRAIIQWANDCLEIVFKEVNLHFIYWKWNQSQESPQNSVILAVWVYVNKFSCVTCTARVKRKNKWMLSMDW